MIDMDRVVQLLQLDCAARSDYRYNGRGGAHSALARNKCRRDSILPSEETMISKALAVSVTGLCLIVPALAEEATPDNGEGRYTFSKVAEGFLRLDTQTGEVSVCSQRAVGWACQAVPEDRAVLENEIARLRSENAALKRDILARGLPLPTGTMPEPPVLRDGDRTPRLGGNSDLDRMMTLVGRMWHRLVEAIVQAEKQVLNKS
jgi:hypothetical protein